MDGRTLDIEKEKRAHGKEGVIKFTTLVKNDNDFNVVLDIGCGEEQTHAKYMWKQGLATHTIDFFDNAQYVGNYNNWEFEEQFDGIHAAHVLEHQLNPHNFLKKIYSDLKEGGILCITVPPMKQKIVGGHVTLWNAGLVLYHLILAGFDCSEANIKTYGYNISVIIKKKPNSIKYDNLVYDNADMDIIRQYIPKNIVCVGKTKRAFDGNIKELNW